MRQPKAVLILTSLVCGLCAGATLAESDDGPLPEPEFHATGDISCALSASGPMSSCPFGVQREGGGTATVTVFLPDNAVRVIRFERGEAKGAEMASGFQAVASEREGDRTRVRIGDQRFEIPDAVIFGG
jgi:hypothetical protein